MLSFSLCLAMMENPEDHGAFAAFFERYHRLVLQKAQNYVGTYESAEDVAQEVMLYAAKNFDRFPLKNDHKIIALLLCCTKSRAIDYLRKNGKFDCVDLEDGEKDMDSIDSSEQIVLTAETAQRVLAAVAALPERYRAPLELKMNDFSYDEIADMLNISKETAYKRIQRGYAIIRERMAAEDGE